jgi:hypothetical protein
MTLAEAPFAGLLVGDRVELRGREGTITKLGGGSGEPTLIYIHWDSDGEAISIYGVPHAFAGHINYLGRNEGPSKAV